MEKENVFLDNSFQKKKIQKRLDKEIAANYQLEKRKGLNERMSDFQKRKNESLEKTFDIPSRFPHLFKKKSVNTTRKSFFREINFDNVLKSSFQNQKTTDENSENVFKFLSAHGNLSCEQLLNEFVRTEKPKLDFSIENRKETATLAFSSFDFEDLFKIFKQKTQLAEKARFETDSSNKELIDVIKFSIKEFGRFLKIDHYEKGVFLDCLVKTLFYFLESRIRETLQSKTEKLVSSKNKFLQESQKIKSLQKELSMKNNELNLYSHKILQIQNEHKNQIDKMTVQITGFYTFYHQLKFQLASLSQINPISKQLIEKIQIAKQSQESEGWLNTRFENQVIEIVAQVSKISNIVQKNDVINDLKQFKMYFYKQFFRDYRKTGNDI